MAVTNLGAERTKRFLRLLSEESFVCVIVTDGELRLFSKGMDDEQLDRIASKLEDMEEGDPPDGEEQG